MGTLSERLNLVNKRAHSVKRVSDMLRISKDKTFPKKNIPDDSFLRIYGQLHLAKKSLSAEKQVWLHLVDLIRNGLIAVMSDDKSGGTKNLLPPRIPHLVTAFLIKSTKVLSNPLDPMFKSISRFVLAKPVMDLFEVP